MCSRCFPGPPTSAKAAPVAPGQRAAAPSPPVALSAPVAPSAPEKVRGVVGGLGFFPWMFMGDKPELGYTLGLNYVNLYEIHIR